MELHQTLLALVEELEKYEMSFSKLQSKAKIKIMKESQEPEPEDEPGMSDQFLANDVMKVTSWLMSSKLENRTFRFTVSVFNLPEGIFCEMLGGSVPAGH